MRGRFLSAFLLAGCIAASATYHVRKVRADRDRAERLANAIRRPPPVLTRTPRVSILVAAWNERHLIERHISSVRCLHYLNKEHVLCAGGTDGTFEIAQRHMDPGTVVLRQVGGEGKQGALRRGFAACRGEIVYLTDADCILTDDSFVRAIAPVVNCMETVTSGESLPFPEQLASSGFVRLQWAAQIYAAAHLPDHLDSLLGRNAAIRRSALSHARAFDRDVSTGTDYWLGRVLRLEGHGIRHVPDSLVATCYPASPAEYARQQRRWLRNTALHGIRTRAWSDARRSLQTTLFGIAMLAGPAVAGIVLRRRSGLVIALWLLALCHGAASRLRYLRFAAALVALPKRPLPLEAGLALAMTVLDYCVWALASLDYSSAMRRRRW